MAELAGTSPSGAPAGGIVGLVGKWAQTLTIAVLLGGGIWFLAALDATVKHNTAALGVFKADIKQDIGEFKAEIRQDIKDLKGDVRYLRQSVDAVNAAIAKNREAIAENRAAIDGQAVALNVALTSMDESSSPTSTKFAEQTR